ncbi:threonylcarbamoyl-AMP synthase [filamentous cyanobacterium CCP5]|nr:threonylcarbamoyl-AMP synthase [filamentous cyanobacterium CCP5]
MTTIYKIHPQTPQKQKIAAVAKALHQGAIVLYPTDTVYAIGCSLEDKSAIERVRRLKQSANDKPLTFLCDSLSNIAAYAHVEDAAYKIIRKLIPGPYTFLLPATKQVPRLVMSPKRRTTGIRVPEHAISQSLMQGLGNPIISTSALTVAEHDPDIAFRLSKAELFDRLGPQVDLIIDDGEALGHKASSIIDLIDEPRLIRRGLGWEALVDWIDEAVA